MGASKASRRRAVHGGADRGDAGDWLAATLNTTGATFEAAPVFTLMESSLLRKLAAVAGLPSNDGGVPPGLFAPGGSTAPDEDRDVGVAL